MKNEATEAMMKRHDAARAVQVDWKITPIRLGEFAQSDNPFHQLARTTERRVANGRSYARDTGKCGKACGIKDRSENLAPHRSFGTMSSQYPELNAR